MIEVSPPDYAALLSYHGQQPSDIRVNTS